MRSIAFGVLGSNLGVDGERVDDGIVATVSASELSEKGGLSPVLSPTTPSFVLLPAATAGVELDLLVGNSGDPLGLEGDELVETFP